MKNALLTVALIWFSYPVLGQSFNLQLDHTTILVGDLDRSAAFYKNIMQLKELETPWGVNPYVRFFSTGGNRQLHIAHDAESDNDGIKLNKSVHIAFAVQDFDDFLGFLREQGVEFGNFAGDSNEPQLRPDGVKQIYFQDPDGYWIEINNAKY